MGKSIQAKIEQDLGIEGIHNFILFGESSLAPTVPLTFSRI